MISLEMSQSDGETEDHSSVGEETVPVDIPSVHYNEYGLAYGQSPKRLRKTNQGGNAKVTASMNRKGQRLWELYHAAKCPHNERDGPCPVSPHCHNMKRLWLHMETCVDNSCRENHCYSSRMVLAHHQQCTWESCPVCKTVRSQASEPTLQSADGSNSLRIRYFNDHKPNDPESNDTNSSPAPTVRTVISMDDSIQARSSSLKPPYHSKWFNMPKYDATFMESKLSPIVERDSSQSPPPVAK